MNNDRTPNPASVNSQWCIIVSNTAELNRQFSRKYPTSYLLCSSHIFPPKVHCFSQSSFDTFLSRSLEFVCAYVLHTSSQNKWKTPIDRTWSCYDLAMNFSQFSYSSLCFACCAWFFFSCPIVSNNFIDDANWKSTESKFWHIFFLSLSLVFVDNNWKLDFFPIFIK